MTTDEYVTWLREHEGYTEIKLFGDSCYAGIKPLLFHWTLIVGLVGDTTSYADRWCYATEELAKDALSRWQGEGEPTGWHRHPATGRRRPGGDAGQEYIAA